MRIIVVKSDTILDSEMLKFPFNHDAYFNEGRRRILLGSHATRFANYLHNKSYKLIKLCDVFLHKNKPSQQGGPNVFSPH